MKSQKWQRNHNFVTIRSENPKVLITEDKAAGKILYPRPFQPLNLASSSVT